MFDILGADIVIFQETKIQRKDLSDDMVLVPGWDCYFSLPKYKKGYSGVVIYTRQAVCSPIRAEEGVTGILCPPNSSTSYRDLPSEQQIGGYPTENQLSQAVVDAATLDSEGRCVVLEFPAFVLLGVYSPANRDETRDDFRLGFLNALDARIRNLVSLGKKVFLTGDLNISREELDAANVEASMRKQGMTNMEFVSTPARRLFNQLLEGGKVFGDRDPGREAPVMWDICRAFHPHRKGMFTCWEQKVNARPANCGARIDYVLCSRDMRDWFSDSNIQEGLMGSDHCPVYAIMKDTIEVDGQERNTFDLMNLPGMFSGGKRQREYSKTTDPLPTSGRLIPEFSGRRNIRDMFTRKPSEPEPTKQNTKISIISAASSASCGGHDKSNTKSPVKPSTFQLSEDLPAPPSPSAPTTSPVKKRSLPNPTNSRSLKRVKSGTSQQVPAVTGKGQQSLKGFLMPKTLSTEVIQPNQEQSIEIQPVNTVHTLDGATHNAASLPDSETAKTADPLAVKVATEAGQDGQHRDVQQTPEDSQPSLNPKHLGLSDRVHDPVETKESWSKLFSKPMAPRCEGHDEPCVSLLTKKPGMNLGRSFWMCPRPLGPTGAKETNTQWRCHTFIWCSDWNSNANSST